MIGGFAYNVVTGALFPPTVICKLLADCPNPYPTIAPVAPPSAVAAFDTTSTTEGP